METNLRSSRAIKMLISNFMFNFFYGGLLKVGSVICFFDKSVFLPGTKVCFSIFFDFSDFLMTKNRSSK